MTQQENELVKALNTYFYTNKIQAVAYRLLQARFSRGQNVDILVDSPLGKYYLAIEAKSMDASKVKSFNFRSRFDCSSEGFQLEREEAFCFLSGRKGILAIELRFGPGRSREMHFLPLEEIIEKFKSGEKSIKVSEIMKHKKLGREKGKYIVSEEMFE